MLVNLVLRVVPIALTATMIELPEDPGDPKEMERVEVEEGLRLRVIARRNVIAGQEQDVGDPQGRRTQQVRLQGEPGTGRHAVFADGELLGIGLLSGGLLEPRTVIAAQGPA